MDPRPRPPARALTSVAGTFEPDPVVPAARLRYQDDQPYALDYRDIYHAADGAAEVGRVFLGPCRIDALARERASRPGAGATVRIGELGFGSGLNFVLAAERCLAAGARLHFVSCDAHPIDAPDFDRIARRRAARHPLYGALAAAYPPRLRGWHQRCFAGGRVRLNLWLGPADGFLEDLQGRQRQPIDAWFLDGFAPNHNPELWEPALFQRLAALSAAGTRVATFTAAGRVRRALEAAGFAMARIDQRPHKRETLAGTFAAPGSAAAAMPRSVLVAGGGLAGASAAWHLARSGCRVTVMAPPDVRGDPPGSALPTTVLHARLLADGSPIGAARHHALAYSGALLAERPEFRRLGVLQTAADAAGLQKLARVAERYAGSGGWLQWLDPAAATALAGWPVASGGLHLPLGGVVDTPALVAALLAHPDIVVVREAMHEVPRDVPVVLACGAATRRFAPASFLELAPVQGQLDLVRLASPPRLPLVGDGYLVPTADGLLAAGSTYEHRPWDPARATASNLRQLEGRDWQWRGRARGTRCIASDRAPVVGALPGDGPALYVSTGHGSAGNASTHLAAAMLAAEILGDCPPLEQTVAAALAPQRFRRRQARRGAWGA